MWNPQERWGRASDDGRPIAIRPKTFGDRPYTEDPEELWGAEVVVLGVPVDARVTGRPGARGGPQAITAASFGPGWNLHAGGASFGMLGVIDYGDVPVGPLDDPRTVFGAIREHVHHILRVGAMPLLMGGDHSLTAPAVAACAETHGPLALIHLDAHADTAPCPPEGPPHHGAIVRWLVEQGHVPGDRCVHVGLRGYWPGPEDREWQRAQGVTSVLMEQVADACVTELADRLEAVTAGGPTYLSIDLDVVDPAFAPNVGTPEPGGMTSIQALRLVRAVARRVQLVGADVVELIGGAAPGDPTAALAERLMREILTGIVLRGDDIATARASGSAEPGR